MGKLSKKKKALKQRSDRVGNKNFGKTIGAFGKCHNSFENRRTVR